MEDAQESWHIETGYASQNQFEKFAKQHREEYKSVFANMDRVLFQLRSGQKFGSFQFKFFRSEGDGLFRVAQTGVRASKESRLYVYPDLDRKIMYVIAIGSKESQTKDINLAKEILKTIRSDNDQTQDS